MTAQQQPGPPPVKRYILLAVDETEVQARLLQRCTLKVLTTTTGWYPNAPAPAEQNVHAPQQS